MSTKLSYHKFSLMPVKQRWHIVSKALEKRGYQFTDNPNKRDRQVKRSLVDFQKSNGLSGNGVICESSFKLLDLPNYEEELT